MGTNYYALVDGGCPACGQETKLRKHLGKMSLGWRFAAPNTFKTADELFETIKWAGRRGRLVDETNQLVGGTELILSIKAAHALRSHCDVDPKSRRDGPVDICPAGFS